MKPEPFYLVGPTASGKSALAITLAERISGEIVNADAFQLYRGLDICTAKPSPTELERVPHHLYSVISPTELCDAQRYCDLARTAIADIIARGKTPIIVGGSGLYVKSLTHGLTPLPSHEILRNKLTHLTNKERIAWLLHRDNEAESNVNFKNDRHVSRALEICLLTGQPQSQLRKAWLQNQPHYNGVRLLWDRSLLNERIDQRVQNMVHTGLVAEIAALDPLSATAEKAIGIRQIRAHLASQCSLAEAIAAIQLATRQYARRQDKWFQRETGFKIIEIHDKIATEHLVHQVLEFSPSLNSSPLQNPRRGS